MGVVCGVGETDQRKGVTVVFSSILHPTNDNGSGQGAVRRPLLVCSRCLDVRPDADVCGQGMSLGAQCVFLDCEGTYRDAN